MQFGASGHKARRRVLMLVEETELGRVDGRQSIGTQIETARVQPTDP